MIFEMRRILVLAILSSVLLSACGLGFARRFGSGGPRFRPQTPAPATQTPTEAPTNTPIPTATMTLTPTPDPAAAGLPTEVPGTNALDFVSTMCRAEWSTKAGTLPCPGDETKPDAGFVQPLPGETQGLPAGSPVLLMYPSQDRYETIFGKYPPFTVKKGDRFRAVLACRAHTFCDVEFSLDYFSGNGSARVATWQYRFTDEPIVVDYPLDGLAGLSVQFSLSVRGIGNRIDAYGVWLFPHIYHPAS